MKIYIKILIIFLYSLNQLNAQDMTGQAGKYGNFIYLGREIPKNFERTIIRNNDNIAKVFFPVTSQAFVSKVHQFYVQNPYFPITADSLLINYWQWATGFRFIDSLPLAAKQVDILVGLGVVYFDELNENNNNTSSLYQYKIDGKINNNSVRITQPAMAQNFKIKAKQKINNEENIIIDWGYKHTYDILFAKAYKQHVGQDDMHPFGGLIFLSRVQDSFQIRLLDTSVIKGLKYKYVISITNPLGFENKMADTVELIHIPKNSLPIIMHAKSKSDDVNKAIKLSWQLQNQYEVQSIDIFRSEYYDSAYSLINTVTSSDTTYSDFRIKPVTAYWYKIVINGVFERGINTVKITGLLKKDAVPLAVNQIQSNILNNGIAITWVKSTNDSRGFYVYRAEGYKGQMQLISPLIIASETQNIYTFIDSSMSIQNGMPFSYSIQIVSKGYVNSELSNSVSASFIAQNNIPLITEIYSQSENKQIVIVWKINHENNPILKYKIYRKKNNDTEWVLLHHVKSDLNQYIDSNVVKGVIYEYKVVPIGLSNQEGSAVFTSNSIAIPTFFAPEIASIFQENNIVKIILEQNFQENVNTIEIYRIQEGKKQEKIATLNHSEYVFIDKNIIKGQSYFYFTKAISNGVSSSQSTPTKIVIE